MVRTPPAPMAHRWRPVAGSAGRVPAAHAAAVRCRRGGSTILLRDRQSAPWPAGEERLHLLEAFALAGRDVLGAEPIQHALQQRQRPLPLVESLRRPRVGRLALIARFGAGVVQRQSDPAAAALLRPAALPFVD